MKSALVLGAGGFIGSHLVKRLKSEGFYVRGVDLKHPEFDETEADEFIIGDLRQNAVVDEVMFSPFQNITFKGSFGLKTDKPGFDEVYQLAADMGGAGFVFSGDNDAEIMHNSALINLNVAEWAVRHNVQKLFYSSSACMYPEHNQMDPDNPNCAESSAYPAAPDSEYGWEKLFSERLFMAFARNHKLNVRIARFHNIFGIEGTWTGGREKAPAAMCRKVCESANGGEIEMWGDGKQTRSFLYIDECIEGVRRLMNSDFTDPVNIGSDEMVTINQLLQIVVDESGKDITVKHIPGPLGVRGRNSDNNLIKEKLGWAPDYKLKDGMIKTYHWIKEQYEKVK
ncbi:MAG: NAD-dependent epimerase/dehydratase family protein [Candidatus Delongbacteria bacterium]|jgi:GDP-D-mannose 3',5'-epimerase|nr:NAD-dependent epimerase/dehydratase family protein [Candidatus Delongbacteria bacterium]